MTKAEHRQRQKELTSRLLDARQALRIYRRQKSQYRRSVAAGYSDDLENYNATSQKIVKTIETIKSLKLAKKNLLREYQDARQ